MVRFCRRCVISDQRPRITFDAEGICSACRFAEQKARTDWDARERELSILCDKYRARNSDYDVIVPCSGGKDGGFVAHQLKYHYGMNPLCVTWAPLMPTEIGRKNLDAFIGSGFDVIQGHANGQINRKLARLAFEHMGDPFQPFIYGQTNFPLQIAVKYGIRLIMYGEDGEAEYGGAVKEFRASRTIEDHDANYFSGKPPEFWTAHGVSHRDLKPFMPPSQLYDVSGYEAPMIHFMSYYKRWDPQENFYYCSEHTGFAPNPERTEGTYSKYASLDDRLDGLHYYLGFIKFGIGRATSDSAHEIRDGKITRDEAVALVHKFDGEFPMKHFAESCEYMGLTDAQARGIIERWRSQDVWDGDKLRSAAWM